MQFRKMNFKVLISVLVGLASVAAAYDPAPMDIGVDDWNYLSNFKLWGTNGIDIKNRPEFYDSRFYDRKNESDFSGYNGVWPDTLGWVGTAKGDLTTDEAGWFDGPIIVGGAVTVPSGYAESRSAYLLTGPIRTTGGIGSARSRGTVCQGTNKSGACADVPEIRSNLSVPGLKGATLSQTYNVSGRTVLNVSSYCSANAICDIYFSSINFSNDSRLVVQMPVEGQPTRIFTNSISFGTHPEIVVAYQGKGELNQSEYEGNLLIYSNGDINFDNTDNVPIMGTIVSKGTITLGRNMIFAGQFIANKIKVGNEIKAETFVFKKFNPMIKLSILSEKTKRIKESDTWETIEVGLSDVSTTDVSFSYCFEFYSEDGVHGNYAGHADVGAADASHAFPICGVSKTKVTIPAGKTNADGIAIKPLIDGLVESDEALWLQISDLQGAELTSDYEAGLGYKIFIVSNDEFPTVKTALTFDVNEDEKHTFTKNEFQFQHTTQNFASVIITSLPNKGALYNGTTKLTSVGSGITVAVADLGKLTYQAAANEFGNNYTTFKYKVVGDGVAGGNTSVEYTATVNVIPVNDKPTVADAVFTVNELDHVVAGGPIVITDVSNERNTDTYTYKLVNVSGSDYAAFNSLFEISKLSNQNATIKVKNNAVINYSQKNKYVVYATVTDDAATETKAVNGPLTSAQFKITVTIKNENDPPTIGNQTFTIAEKQDNGKVWPAGTLVGMVTTAIDPDDDPLTYSVVTTGVPFKFDNGSNQLVITDGSVLDFETKPTWTFKVQISDGELTATATVTVNLEDVDEPSPSIVFDYEGDVLVNGNASTGDAIDNFTSNNSKEIQDQLSEIVSDLSYTLASNTSANVTDYFNIDIESGDITAKTELVFEALYPDYAFTIGIDATGKNVSDEPVSVNISKKIVIKDVNEAPVITNENPLVVSGSVLNNGGIVGKVEAVDPDSCSYNPLYVCANGSHPYGFNKLKYSIKEVIEVDGSIDFPFEIDPNTGVISVSKGPSLVKRYNYDYTSVVRKVTSLNSTKQKQYQFIVEVTDSSSDSDNESKSVQKLMSIDVTEDNTAPVFESVSSEYVVSENTAVGETIGEAILVFDEDDADVNGLTVSIADKDECDAEKTCAQHLFEIVQDGETDAETRISKFFLKVKNSMDFEALCADKGGAVFSVVLTIKDAEENETEKYARIKVTDVNEEPYFTMTTDEIEMAENTTVSTVAITFEDKDKFANNNNELVIITDDSGIFEINFDGKIQLKKGAALDYESKNEYEITVRVRDAGVDGDGNLLNPNLCDDKTFKITVTDVNEEPVFAYSSYEYFIREDIDVDVSNLVGSVSAVDPDADATITYSLDGDDAALFDINASTGEIVIKDGTTFDYETKTSYVFVVVASDGKFEVRSLVTVEIVDVNEKPVFEKPSYEFTVEENAEQTVLGSVSAVDHDVDGTVIYSLVGDESESFVINKNTGEITTNENVTFDYESKSSYTFEVVASDEILENRVPVTVNVVDFPESPIFPEDITTVFYIDENASSGTTVGTVVATDDDCKGDFSESCALPTYTLSPFIGYEAYGDLFTIGSGGTIKLAKDGALDYDVKNVYEYHVLATDGSDESLTYSVDITINVRKVAHEPEIADDGHDSYNVAESTDDGKTSTGSEIACYVVSDKDSGQVENLSASFTDLGSTKANNFFKAEIKKVGSIYKLCLVVKDGSKLDYETVAHTHKVKISVVDSDNKTASLTKTINITDVNEKPSISGSLTNFFYEHEGKNHLVGQLYADDPDTSKAFTDNIFKAVGGDTDLFMITENGLIKTKRDFDFEKETRFSYTLDVSLYDRNTEKYPDYKSSAKVLISLKNSPNDPVESSSSKAVSSSSAKPASSSSNSKPASSSSKTVASSSSKNIVTPESSVSSSNSNASDYGIPTFHVRVVAPFEFEIVMDESLPRLAKQYAVMDMMGHVISTGELSDKDTRVKVSTRGAYVVRVGLGYKRVNVK